MNQALKNNSILAQLKQTMLGEKKSVQGIVRSRPEGYGFLNDNDGNSYFVAPPMMQKVLDGDLVKATIESENNREFAVITEVIASDLKEVYGIIRIRKGHPWLEPESASNWLFIQSQDRLTDSSWAKVRIIEHPFATGRAKAEILDIIALPEDLAMPWNLAMHRNGILRAPRPADESLIEPGEEGVEDLTHLPFVTIDSQFTMDVDDALYAEAIEGGYRVYVAIADPANYVVEGCEVDQEARKRAVTTYLPGESHGMLNAGLSEGSFSLLEGMRRRALVCQFELGETGEIRNIGFKNAVVISKAKLSYQGVAQYLNGETNLDRDEEIRSVVRALHQGSAVLRAKREREAIVQDYGMDYRFVVNNYSLMAIVKELGNQATDLVQDYMVAANRIFADFCHAHGIPCIYRVQAGFAEARLEKANKILANWGLGNIDNTQDLDAFVKIARSLNEEENLIPSILLRSAMDKSKYSLEAKPHMGLGFERYATFTSPIRKYSDLLNHRMMKAYLAGKTPTAPSVDEVDALSEKSRLANLASREVAKFLYARYYNENLEKAFTGIVIGMGKSGLTIRDQETGASLFAKIRSMTSRDQVVSVDEFASQLTIDGNVAYRIGDQVNFAVMTADTLTGKVEIKIV